MLAMAQAGREPVPHPGRFALTSFLFNIGVPREEILAYFGTVARLRPVEDEVPGRPHHRGDIRHDLHAARMLTPCESLAVCFHPDNLCRVEWVEASSDLLPREVPEETGSDAGEDRGEAARNAGEGGLVHLILCRWR